MPLDVSPTVLVVDDETPVRKLARIVLERENYRVLEGRDGREALRVMEREPAIEVVISDLRMPVMSGKRFGVAARQLRPSLRILYLTGHADLLFEDRIVLDENEAFLDKPFSGRGLVEAVSLLLSPRHQPALPVERAATAVQAGPLARWSRRVLPLPLASARGR